MAREVSRRRFMQAMIGAGLSVGGASVLAACGAPTATPTTAPTVAPTTLPPTVTPTITPTAVAVAMATQTVAPATATPTVTPDLELAIETMYLALPDGRQLEVRSTGPKDGEILLVQHGTPQAGLPYMPMAKAAAARGLRTVTYSRPGYGGSSSMPGRKVIDAAADVARVVDAFDSKTFRTIGLSGGGPHALACAAALPDRCLATVAVGCCAPYPAEGLDWFDGMCQENVREYRLAMQGAAALKPLLQGVVPTLGPEDIEGHPESCLPEVDMAQLTGEFRDWLIEAQSLGLAFGTDGWQDDDLAFVGDWGFDLRDARVVSLWNGGQDRLVPPAHSAWLADHIPGARHRQLDSEGHLSIITKALEDMLDELMDLAG